MDIALVKDGSDIKNPYVFWIGSVSGEFEKIIQYYFHNALRVDVALSYNWKQVKLNVHVFCFDFVSGTVEEIQ